MNAWNWKAVPEELEARLETDKQKEAFRLFRTGMSLNDMIKNYGLTRTPLTEMRRRIKRRLTSIGYDPENGMTMVSPEPQILKGRSSYIKRDPETGDEQTIGYWNKTDHGATAVAEKLQQYADRLAQNIQPAKPIPLSKKKGHDSELMVGIFIGDAHIGMYAYSPETRHSDFDTDIAITGLREAIDNLVARAPLAETGLLVDVGDFMHADTSHNKTFAGTDVDVDTRYERILSAAADLMDYAVKKMLAKFQRVVVVIAKGNHNPNAAVAVQKIVEGFYRNEVRVDVLRTASFFHYIEWGKWLIGINHGDKIKPQKLVNVMARDQAEAWGRTNSRMWALGHFHHQNVLELDGCTVQKFAALPPPDGWHSSMGYSSGQAMQMIVFKKEGGKESTLIFELTAPTRQPDLTIK